jgi:hypothetical protein
MIDGPTLSSASILLAIMTALFGFFNPSIKEVLAMVPEVSPNEGNNQGNRKKAVSVLRSRVLVLLIGSFTIALIFLPELVHQLINAKVVFHEHGIDFSYYYIPAAAFVAVSAFTLTEFVVIFVLFVKVWKKVNKLVVPKS